MKILLISRISVHRDPHANNFRRVYNHREVDRTFVNHWGWYWLKALEEMQHKVLPFAYNQSAYMNRKYNLRNPYLFDLYKRIAKKTGWAKVESSLANRGLIKVLRHYNPDMVLIDSGDAIFPETLKTIRRLRHRPVMINWLLDDPFQNVDMKNVIRGLPYFDNVFVFDSHHIKSLKSAGAGNVEYLPLSCDPDIHRRYKISETERTIFQSDVSFVGTITSKREALFKGLTDFDFKIWGNYPKWSGMPPEIRCRYMGKASGEVMGKIYSCTKIVLNIHHDQSVSGLNLRVFEAAGCGSFQLVDPINGMSKQFEPGKEIICYNNLEDLKRKIVYYLENRQQRDRIGNNAQIKAYSEHTYKHRMTRILESVGAK